MMQFVKAHWISLLCGVVGLGAIVVAALGMMDDTVVKTMEERARRVAEIRRLRGNPQNEQTISAEQQRTKEFERKYEAALEFASEKNRREPLLPGVFPDPGQRAARYEFKEEYRGRVHALPRIMNAGDRPTEREARNEQEILDDIARRKAEQEAESGVPTAPTEEPSFTGGGGRAMGGRAMGGRAMGGRAMGGRGAVRGGGGGGGGDEPPVPRPVESSGPPSQEAVYRAMVRKASNIPVYASVEPSEPSFDISPIVASPEAPTPREMWYAQVGLWVQEDLASAIRKANDAAKERLADSDQANVTTLPVKRLVSVQIHGYVDSYGQLAGFGAIGGGEGRGGEVVTFTGRRSNEQFDVLRFTATMIVDQRDLHEVIDAITRENFYQLVGIDFKAEPPDSIRQDGFFYGSEPIIRVTMDFEGYMARKVYKEMMPRDVLIDLGIIATEGEE